MYVLLYLCLAAEQGLESQEGQQGQGGRADLSPLGDLVVHGVLEKKQSKGLWTDININIGFSYTQENMLNSLCYWLGISNSGQSSHCHMQVLIASNLTNRTTAQPYIQQQQRTSGWRQLQPAPHVGPGICKGPHSQYNNTIIFRNELILLKANIFTQGSGSPLWPWCSNRTPHTCFSLWAWGSLRPWCPFERKESHTPAIHVLIDAGFTLQLYMF